MQSITSVLYQFILKAFLHILKVTSLTQLQIISNSSQENKSVFSLEIYEGIFDLKVLVDISA